MAAASGTQPIQLVLQELEEQLQEVALYALRYGKGWDRVEELQGLCQQYQMALDKARQGRPEKAPEAVHKAA